MADNGIGFELGIDDSRLGKSLDNITKRLADMVISAEKTEKQTEKIGDAFNKNVNDVKRFLVYLEDLKRKIEGLSNRSGNSSIFQNDLNAVNKLLDAVYSLDALIDGEISKFGKSGLVSNFKNSIGFDTFDKNLKAKMREIEKEVRKAEKEAEIDTKTADIIAKNAERVKIALLEVQQIRSKLWTALQGKNIYESDRQRLQNLFDLLTQYEKLLNRSNNASTLSDQGLVAKLLGANYKGEIDGAKRLLKELGDSVQKSGLVNHKNPSKTIESGVQEVLQKELERNKKIVEEYDALSRRLAEVMRQYNEAVSKGVIPQSLANERKSLLERFNDPKGQENLRKAKEQIVAIEKALASTSKYADLGQNAGLANIDKKFGDAGKAAQEYATRQRELNQAFDKYFQAQEREAAALQKNTEKQRQNNRARQESVRATRQQMEAAIKSRLEMLKTQRQELMSGISKGRGFLSPEVLEQSRNALKQVTQEIMTIEGVVRNLGSYSTGALGQLLGTGTAGSLDRQLQSVTLLTQKSTREQKEAEAATRRLSEANKSLMSSYDKVTQSMRQQMNTLSFLRQQLGYYFSLFGAQQLLKNVITIGGQFEFQHRALENIIGDGEKATQIFAELKGLAVESPKTFMELASSAKQLAAYQIPTNELFETTKRLSDLSVGLGVDVNRLILAFGQVRSAAVLRGQELRQFTEAGIPLVKALADKFTELNGKLTTNADVFKLISQRAVSFEMVRDVLWDMTNQGGQFFNMQAEMADTLFGKWQKLQDIWQITLGDIADANSLTGRLFSTALDGIIFLARNLRNILPMLSTFAAFFAARAITRGVSKMFGGLDNIDKNIQKAQKLQAIELMRRHRNGEITTEQYRQLSALNSQKDRYYLLLGMEGKLNKEQMRRLITQKGLTNARLHELVAQEKLTMREAALIRLQRMRMMNAGSGNTLGNLGSSVLGFLGGWTGVAATVIGGIASIYSYYNRRSKEMQERSEAMASKAKETAKELRNSYDAIADKAVPTGKEELQHQVEAMKELLKNHDLYTESINNSVESATTLSEKYEILKKSVKEAAEAQQMMADYSELAKQAIENSGFLINATTSKYGGITSFEVGNERVDENIQEYEASYKKLESYVNSLGDVREKIESEINKIGGSLGNSLKGKDLEEQIRILVESGAWDELVERFEDTDSDLAKYLKRVGKYADDANDKWTEIANDDIPRIVETIKQWIPAKGEEAIKKWAQSNETTVQAMINAIARMITVNAPKIRTAFINAIRGVFGLESIGTEGNAADNSTPYTRQSVASKNLMSNIVKAYGNGVTSVKEMAQWIGDVNNEKTYDEAFEGIKKARDAAKKTYNAAKAAKKDTTKEKKEYERLEKIFKGSGAEDFFAAQDADKKSKNNKTDAYAKAMNERVSVLSDAYNEYKKWQKIIGKDAAMNKVKGSGIFSALFSGNTPVDLDDYKKTLRNFRNALDPSKTEQRKVIEKIDKMLLGIEYDEAKEKIDKSVALLQEGMDKIARQWTNYKSLYDKTGNKGFAEQAFSDGVLWDEKSRAMADTLRNAMSKPDAIDYTMSEQAAKDFFNYNSEEGKALYEQWKKISDLIHENYIGSLNDIAAAYASLMTTSEKIAKVEQEIADLREKGAGANDVRVLAKEKELKKLQGEAFEESADYIRFYSAILGMTIDEAEKIGTSIKKNLVEQLAQGNINADKFLKSMKNVDAQLDKARGRLFGGSDFGTFIQGGQKGLTDKRYDELMNTAIELQKAEEELQAARKNGTAEEIEDAELMVRWRKMQTELAERGLSVSLTQLKTLNDMALILDLITGALDGLKGAAQSLSEMFSAIGNEDAANTFSDIADGIGIVSDTIKPISNVVSNLMNGNVSGAVSNALMAPVNMVTAPITGIAKLHDKKLDRVIQKSVREVKKLEREYKRLEEQIENALGSIYTSGGYNEMYENYKKQLEELEYQREAEAEKKESDKDKLFDYDSQIEEMRSNLQNFALDMAESLYDIDVKSWSKELTNAIVSAWDSGQDAVKAYHDKVQELMKDIAVNILSQKVLEAAFDQLGIEDVVSDLMSESEGQLDPLETARQLADMLNKAGEATAQVITDVLDEGERLGYWARGDKNGSSGSLSAGIRGITEETADLLASYVNAIRAYVAIDNSLLQQLVGEQVPELTTSARAQLQQLQQIQVNTSRMADVGDEIYLILSAVVNGTRQFSVK